MKKLFILLALAAILFASCSKDDYHYSVIINYQLSE